MSYEDEELARALAASFICEENEEKARNIKLNLEYIASLKNTVYVDYKQKDDSVITDLLTAEYFEQKDREEQTDRDHLFALEMQFQEPIQPKTSQIQKNSIVKYLNNEVQFYCPNPNCHEIVSVDNDQFNCRIFRCGYYLGSNGDKVQFPQHASESEIALLIYRSNGHYRGCGNPFRLEGDVLKKTVKPVRGAWTD